MSGARSWSERRLSGCGSAPAGGAGVLLGLLAGRRRLVDRDGALRVEQLLVRRPLTRQVALAAVDVHPHAGAVLAELIRSDHGRVPPDDRRIVDAVVVDAFPVALLA